MRNVKGRKIYTSYNKSDWNLYKVSVRMGRNLYKPVQIRGLYKNHSFSMGDTMLWFSQIRFISLFAAY